MYYREETTDNRSYSFKTRVTTDDRLSLSEARRLAFKIAGGRLRRPTLTAWYEPGNKPPSASPKRPISRQTAVKHESGEVNVDVGPGDYFFIFTEAKASS